MKSKGSRNSIFFSSFGLRSGWRVLLFLVVFLGLNAAVFYPLRHFLHTNQNQVPWSALAEGISAVLVILCTYGMAKFIDHKPFTTFGLEPAGSGRRFGIGLFCGFASLSLLLLMLRATGYLTFGPPLLHGQAILGYASYYILFFLAVALTEELTTRGYLLFALTNGIGFWPAAIVLSLLFGAGHLGNPGETLCGIAAACAIGLVLAWTVLRTGSLWWAIGFHLAWDWGESYFYGVPDSGQMLSGHLLNATLSGPAWLSGGTDGPEGSVFVFVVVIILVAAVYLLFGPTPPDNLHRLKGPRPLISPPASAFASTDVEPSV